MKLKNVSKRMVVVTLPHEEVCVDECFCSTGQHLQTAHNRNTGDVGVRQIAVRIPQSLYIPAGSESAELPEAFANARSVRALLNNGLRKVA